MAVSGIQSCNTCDPQNMLRNFQTVKSDSGKPGQDLKSGKLSQAQTDFATLSQNLLSGPQNTTDQDATDFTTLAYSSVQQAGGHRHHHHHQGSSGQNSAISQDFSTLGQDQESDDVSAAQKAFATRQKDLQQYANNYQYSTATQAAQSASSISVSA